jgi:glycosyltransferase involved in cell wall biosynthesis
MAGVRRTIYGFHGKTLQDLQKAALRRRLTERLVIRCYDRLVTLNPRMRADFAKSCGLPEHRIELIANGVDVTTFRPYRDPHALRVSFGIPTDRFVVGNVARLDPVKNHEVILRALGRISPQPFRPYFLLVGDGPHRTMVEREIQQLGLHNDVRLFGFSTRIAELLNCMDVYVQGSLYEGFSNTIIEAMACGLPVLATNVGGTADLFSHGAEGWFFSPKADDTLSSLILELQQNPSLRKLAGVRGRERVIGQFSVETMVSRYENLYLKLAENNRHLETGAVAVV